MEGGFQFDKLGFFQKKMLNIVKKSVAKKENKTEQDIYMEKVLGTSFDNSDKKFIEPLIKCVSNQPFLQLQMLLIAVQININTVNQFEGYFDNEE